ncbi:TOM core complex subunit Tom6 [Ustulina deusta]|nr:TOM core complex subunit Tom6 [Ustulina deusta]KAI3333645.1 TOM core complex subunit Tom6 [Ustulina deusta]
MAPKRVFIESGTPRSRAPKGVIASTYSALTSPENASVVKSVAIFGAAVALFASPLSEYLLPP